MAGIYDFSSTNFAVFEVTTTLYPVDVQDSMIFSSNIISGEMYGIPGDHLEADFLVVEGVYEQKRWFYEATVSPDHMDSTFSVLSSTYEQKRWFYEETTDPVHIESIFSVISATYVSKQVPGQAPVESLYFGVNINEDCEMETV